ncbi:MAG TPA: 23S rRNA (adenine(2030)-N(6))-methyltransferase RlmJ [Micropepsaceae bacterium]|nr:23S rRNA (adenine(2030)-N(6))-methyltransferase RlmJ [Micropepsaceae bacterium]
MNYRHAYHAGNFADVLKHSAFVAVLLHLKKKDKPFAVIDTHAGRGLYDLSGEEAVLTGEAAAGVARLIDEARPPGVLAVYLDVVRSFAPHYPGSPLIAARLLRQRDRLIAIEKQEDEFRALERELAPIKQTRAIKGDGYEELKKLMPPAERRAMILIDPPYEEPDEFKAAIGATIAAHRRFATGIFLLWYPAKERPQVAASSGELLTSGVKSLLKLELDVGVPPDPVSPHGGVRLTATGLLVVNPPYGFSGEMNAILPYLTRTLAQGKGARFVLERLKGEE